MVNNYKSGMPLKFSVYDRDFSYKAFSSLETAVFGARMTCWAP